MKRSLLTGAAAACLSLGSAAPSFADSTPAPAAVCLADVHALIGDMQKDGFWVGGSDYGYGYPVGAFGYGYPMGGERMAGVDGYLNARPGYEVRNLIASANILGQDGQQKACEDLLTATRVVYKGYAAELKNGGMTMTDGTNWRAGQIAGAQPVTDKTADLRPDQLLDLDLRNAHDEALGSVHDLVVSPKTGKIAYLIIARGGLFGIDQSYVPVPWDDFKVTQNVNLLVLDTTKALMTGAPEMTDAQLTAKGQFAAQSKIIDAYWQAHPITKVGG